MSSSPPNVAPESQRSLPHANLTGPQRMLLEQRLLRARQAGGARGSSRPAIAPQPDADVIPLSHAQERLWFLDQLVPDRSLYNVYQAMRLTGPLDANALERGLAELVRRHDVFRTTFAAREEGPVQVIANAADLKLERADVSGLAPDRRGRELAARLQAEAKRPFDLARDRLLRALLVRVGPDEHVLLLVMHHIVSDGWSLGLLFRELGILHEAFSSGKPSPLPGLPIRFADYALWERKTLQGDGLDRTLSYWRRQLDGAAMLEMPTDHPRPPEPTVRGGTLSRVLPPELVREIRALSQREGATPFMTLLAAFSALLHRYTGQDDIVVGSCVAGRPQVELENLAGFFVNTIVLRTNAGGQPTFHDLLLRTRETVLGAMAHQDLPFEKLVAELQPDRSSMRNPFFQVMFVLQSAGGPQPQAAGLKFEPIEMDNGTSKFDFSISLVESTAGGLHLAIEYRSDLFEAATIGRLLGHYQTLLAAAVRSPGERVARLPLMSAAERHQVLAGWNATGTEFPRDRCIHELVEEQVHRTPAALAVSGRGQQWTYAELNERANRFAHQLARLEVEPEMPVAVLVHRSPEMIAVLLGVLKAGGAYLPFDPVHPPERIAATLRDARARVLVTEKALWDRLAPHAPGITPLFLDAGTDDAVREPTGNPGRAAAAENLAYVIYTSGSTGTPKGVAVTHRNVANLITWYQRAWKIVPSDRTTQLMSPAFDPSVLEIWSSLTVGASLHLPPDDVRVSPPDLVRWLAEHRVTVSILPTPLGEALLDENWPRGNAMRLLLTGGDRLQRRPPDHLPCPLINLYGPTESTVVTTWSTVAREGEVPGAPDIGHPMANTEVYVLDAHLQPVPTGIAGELFIGGTGLARGYLHQPALTAERFVPNPLADAPSPRLYRTGDRVRFRFDGALEYLGRLDEQVKVRGFRIEPGEIEAALSAQPGVRECVVIAREDIPGDKRLVAYVVVPSGAKPELQTWRAALGRRLPDYMVPSAFVLLDKLPLTSNGKINRGALPAPDRDAGPARRTAVAPRDAVEAQLARIWEQVLGLEAVGVNESFFQLGGHSMAGVRLFGRIEKEFGRRLPLASLFEHPTIEQLAHRLRSPETATTCSSLVALQPRGGRPPVFFMHGAGGGNLWTYTNLVPHLGADQPVYALESRGMRGLGEFTTIEEMATNYIREIRTVQPRGPYYLAGYCFGGNVAFEMACQLEAAGERVAFVGLLDSAASNSSYQKLPWWRPEFYCRFAGNTAFWLTDFLAQSGRDQWRFVHRKTRAIFRRLVRGDGAPEVDEVIDVSLFPEIELDLWKTHLHALARYEASSAYRGRLALFRTRGHPFLCSFDPMFGWGSLARDGVEVIGVPGAHERVFVEPHVRELSARFRAQLDLAQHRNHPTPAPAQ